MTLTNRQQGTRQLAVEGHGSSQSESPQVESPDAHEYVLGHVPDVIYDQSFATQEQAHSWCDSNANCKGYFLMEDGQYVTLSPGSNTYSSSAAHIQWVRRKAKQYSLGSVEDALFDATFASEDSAQASCDVSDTCKGYFLMVDGTYASLKQGRNTYSSSVSLVEWVKRKWVHHKVEPGPEDLAVAVAPSLIHRTAGSETEDDGPCYLWNDELVDIIFQERDVWEAGSGRWLDWAPVGGERIPDDAMELLTQMVDVKEAEAQGFLQRCRP